MNKETPKLKSWMLIIILVLTLLVISITAGGREGISFVENTLGNLFGPVQKSLTSMSYFFSEKTYPIRHMFKLSEENARLKEELLETRKELIAQTMLKEELQDLKTLRKANNYTRRYSYDNGIVAEIVSRDPGNFYSMFVVNAGTSKGIIKNSMVFDANGLIGQVYECGEDWSKVLTITDSKGGVSFRVLDSEKDYNGVVYGTGESELEGFLYDFESKIAVGDKIITSGVGVYPRGVVIGEVSEVKDLNASLLPEIKVKPYVNFKRINRVLIIPPYNEYEEGPESNEG
ncbi:MAG: rod shape-determining protein MreC [Bacillota bacterium]|nr:rod shape-determining protein MreC [Bacillota bacterium]